MAKYPRFPVDTFTIEQCRELFREADDSEYNQVRIDLNGEVYISKDIGGENLEGVKCRFESFIAGNEYVGPKAAKDEKYILKQYERIKLAWEKDLTGYIDYPLR